MYYIFIRSRNNLNNLNILYINNRVKSSYETSRIILYDNAINFNIQYKYTTPFYFIYDSEMRCNLSDVNDFVRGDVRRVFSQFHDKKYNEFINNVL